LRKANVSFVMCVRLPVRPSVRLSVCQNPATQLPLDGFSLNLIFEILLEYLSRKINFRWNLTRIADTLLDDLHALMMISRSVLVKWEMFHTKYVQKIKIHTLLFLIVYEIMWKIFVQSDRPQITIWRMRIAFWTPKAINTYAKYVMLVAFPWQQWLHELPTVTCDTYIVLFLSHSFCHHHMFSSFSRTVFSLHSVSSLFVSFYFLSCFPFFFCFPSPSFHSLHIILCFFLSLYLISFKPSVFVYPFHV
jgi:hypothetical protein